MTANQLYLEAETYSNKFLELCDPIKQFLDLDNVAYYEVNSDGSATSIHSSYKWMEEYIAGEHYLEDPHMVHPSNMHKGFCIIIIKNITIYCYMIIRIKLFLVMGLLIF